MVKSDQTQNQVEVTHVDQIQVENSEQSLLHKIVLTDQDSSIAQAQSAISQLDWTAHLMERKFKQNEMDRENEEEEEEEEKSVDSIEETLGLCDDQTSRADSFHSHKISNFDTSYTMSHLNSRLAQSPQGWSSSSFVSHTSHRDTDMASNLHQGKIKFSQVPASTLNHTKDLSAGNLSLKSQLFCLLFLFI